MVLNSTEAQRKFEHYLKTIGVIISDTKTIPTSAGRGRTVFQKQIWTETNEVYHIKHWSKKWVPKETKRVSDFAKPLDERIKFVIKHFGKNDDSASGLNELTLLNLLGLQKQGYEAFLITTYSTGDILWCRAVQLYEFATMYGLIPQFSITYGEPFCWVPTGWLNPLYDTVSSKPIIIRN